jgi:hypothetical protein
MPTAVDMISSQRSLLVARLFGGLGAIAFKRRVAPWGRIEIDLA